MSFFNDTITNLVINAILLLAFIGVASVLGAVFINVFPFQFTVELFAFFRFLLSFVDKFIHMPTLLTLLGVSFAFMSFYWAYRALIFVIRFFNKQ